MNETRVELERIGPFTIFQVDWDFGLDDQGNEKRRTNFELEGPGLMARVMAFPTQGEARDRARQRILEIEQEGDVTEDG